jgi:epidermal growth factor receptor substrate 15
MRQTNTPLRSVEQSPDAVASVSAGLEGPHSETLTTESVESEGAFSTALALFDSLSAVQLLAVLALIGILVVVAAWYLDGMGHRIEREMYWRRTWWGRKWKSIKSLFKPPRGAGKLELSSVSGSAVSDAEHSHSFVSTLTRANSAPVGQADPVSTETEFRDQPSADEFSHSSETEDRLRFELSEAKEQLSLLIQREEDARDLGSRQIESLESDLADRATQLEKLQASLAEAASDADRMGAALEESNGRCQELSEELAALKQVEASAKSELADAAKEIESLSLKATRSDEKLQAAAEEASEKADVADRLREECTLLKSSLEEAENQCAEKDASAAERLRAQDEIQDRLQKKIDHLTLVAKESESGIAERESQLVASQEEIARLNTQIAEQAEDARQKIDETLAALSEEQTLHNRLKETAVEDWEELSSQATRLREQESKIDLLTKQLANQAAKSEQELSTALATLEQERSVLAKFKEDSKKREEDQRTMSLSQMKMLKEDLTARTTQVETLETSLAKAASDAKLVTASLEKSDGRCQELCEELAALKQVGSTAKSELAAATKELEAFRLKATRSEKDLQTAIEEARENADLADRLTAESAALKSSLKRIESQLEQKEANAVEHAKAQEKQRSQWLKEIDNLALATKRLKSEIAERESQLVASKEEVERLNAQIAEQAEDARQKLGETLAALSDERALHNRLKEATSGNGDELSLQASKLREQEAAIELLNQQAIESEQKLVEALETLDREKADSAATKEAAGKRDEEMDVLVAKNADLERNLESIQQRSEAAEREFAETLERLKDEQELRSKTLQELEVSEKRVGELEKEIDASSVSLDDHNKLIRKLVGYRKAYRKIKAVMDELAVQKSEMSDLATEYLSMAKTVRHELDEERETNLRLKSELEKANSSGVDFDDPQIKRQVDRIAGKFVLDLKTQFERKLKKKNELIRELQSRKAHDTSID